MVVAGCDFLHSGRDHHTGVAIVVGAVSELTVCVAPHGPKRTVRLQEEGMIGPTAGRHLHDPRGNHLHGAVAVDVVPRSQFSVLVSSQRPERTVVFEDQRMIFTRRHLSSPTGQNPGRGGYVGIGGGASAEPTDGVVCVTCDVSMLLIRRECNAPRLVQTVHSSDSLPDLACLRQSAGIRIPV